MNVEAAIYHCTKAAEEAYQAAMEPHEVEQPEWAKALMVSKQVVEGNKEDAHSAAALSFINNMPELTSRAACRAFIACVAVGLQRKYITAMESKTLLYSVQLALTVNRPRHRRERTTPPPTTA
jgi:hypothetical protein